MIQKKALKTIARELGIQLTARFIEEFERDTTRRAYKILRKEKEAGKHRVDGDVFLLNGIGQ